ncbi:putative target of rapamycin complex subunit lst8 [Apostichopus japonicus]|uniref:Target of rapamycin complex subunit lst8 n=1 Tax=Stichopus japonicus TaxID=307972 RepID=A0A2G8KNI2_STIJA|nr:putative target of rapamycin complex subunit lst8 [Apostichopus japonicus]
MSSGGNGDQVILATAGYDHTIRFWQAHTGICQRTVQHPDSQVNCMEITPDRRCLAAAGYQHIRMYDINSNDTTPTINFDGVSKNVTAVGFQEDGKWMYTGGDDCSARIWDLRSRTLHCQKIFQVNAPVNTVALHPNQGELFVGDQSGTVYVWDIRSTRNEQLVPEEGASIQSIAINSDASLLTAVNNKGTCYVWRLTPGKEDILSELHPKCKKEAHRKYALKCKFSPDCTLLATTSADQTVKIWKTADFSLLTTLEANQRWVWDCAFSSDSQYLVTASSDHMARLWSVEQGTVKREFNGHQKAVTALAFSDAVPRP